MQKISIYKTWQSNEGNAVADKKYFKLVVKGEWVTTKFFTTHNLRIQITYFQFFAQNILIYYQTHNFQSLYDILHLYILLQI